MASWREDKKNSNERGYGSKWKKYRLGYLKKNPLCIICQREGKYIEATVVDHIQPHKGNQKLFWDKSNHQPLCKHCHDSYKQRLEKRNVQDFGCDEDGYPNDPSHHWNK